jgi:parvulin-like peptidyl-prolyl isomerase
MKRILCVAVLGAAVALTGCKMKGDVLATYTDGKIKRGEFYEWMDLKHLVKESILKSKKQQKTKLEQMAIDRFAVQEAKKAGFDKSDEFKIFADMAIEAQLMDMLYTKEIKEKVSFKEPSVKAQQIFLRIKDFKIDKNKREKLSDAELEKEAASVTARARDLVARLNKGEKFDALAKQYSEDFSKKNGGEIGYIIADMMPPEYTKAAFSLKEDEFTKEPVRVGNGVYIIKVLDKKDLTDKNIEKTIKDKMQVTRLKNRFYSKASKEYLQKLMTDKDVSSDLDKAKSRNPKDIIFKVGTTTFTVDDLNKRISLYMGRYHQGPQAPTITDDQKKSLAENFFKFELLKRVAIKQGFDKDPEYIKKVEMKKDSILAREYLKKIGSQNLTVSDKDILDEYNANKDKRYYTMVQKGANRVKVVEQYAKVRDRIKKILENKKQSESIRNWKQDILAKNNFTVKESKLEGE